VSKYEPLDDAIDRTVRDMTHVATDDDAAAVARVMARLREADARGVNARERAFVPRLAWASAAVVVLIAIVVTSYWLRPSAPDTNVPRIAEKAPAPSSAAPSSAPPSSASTARENPPTRATRAASTVHATALAREAREARDVLPEPLESDIAIASITPAPLGDAPAIYVEPLVTASMQVDAIPLPSIEMPPVSPERQE
jgi:hypothetical protein